MPTEEVVRQCSQVTENVFVLQDIKGPQGLGEALKGEHEEEEEEEEDVQVVGAMTIAESDVSDEEVEEKGREGFDWRKQEGKPEWDSSSATY